MLKNSFLNPDNEFTPIPFWFWNDTLDKAEIKRQIMDFYDKGVMGFIIHPRIGIPEDIEYLSDRFMDYVKYAVELAADLGMLVILYDEGCIHRALHMGWWWMVILNMLLGDLVIETP